LAVYVGVQHGRQRQILRSAGHGRIGGRQIYRGGHGQVRRPRSDRPLRRHARSGGPGWNQCPWSGPALAAAARPGFEL